MAENNKKLQALAYAERLGFSIIPVGKNKKPLIKWEAYQKQKASPDEIKNWWVKWPDANIGIVTGMISNLAVIDVDTEEGKEAIQGYIPESLIMPVCSTPKSGQHMYFTCPDEKLTNNARVVPGCDLRANGGYVVCPPSDNGNGQAYAFLKGLSPFEIDRPALPEAYLSFIKNASCINTCSCIKGGMGGDEKPLFIEGHRNEDLFHIAHCLTKGSAKRYEAEQVLKIIAKNCIPPYPEKEIETIIQSALDRKVRGESGLTDDIKRIISFQDGFFHVADLVKQYQEYQNITDVSNSIKNQVRVIVKRLRDDGIIQKEGKKEGIYRRVDEISDVIDWENADVKPLEIAWPFNIEDYFNTYKKNIAVVAGSPDAGKTAFLLNFAAMNVKKHETHFFSCEMGAIELKSRIMKFDSQSRENFKKVRFYERTSNFVDVIRPDKVNIIDYIELTEDFWKVTLYIKEIFDKLTSGIAVIALQKKRGQQVAIGGEGSLQKPRLYLAMDSGRLQIVKAKNWAHDGINPTNLVMNFKLVQGCGFIPKGTWERN
jgi:hypothetical protein